MAEGFNAKGALLDCYEHYPYFEYDLKILVFLRRVMLK